MSWTWKTTTVATAAVLTLALSGCSAAAEAQKADRATELGCTEVPSTATSAVEATLTGGYTLGEGSTGFERDGSWLVAAPLVDSAGVTENAAFAVDLATDPATVTSTGDAALQASSAPTGADTSVADVLDCIFTVS
jgi:hypothetical protein